MIKKLAYSIIFLGLLESIIYFQKSNIILIIACVLLFLLSIVSSVRLKALQKIGFWGQVNISILPLSYILSTSVFLFFIPELFNLQQIYIALVVIIFYGALKLVDNVCKDINSRKSFKTCDFLITISAFLFYSSIFGMYLFLKWPSWIFLILLALVTFILTYEFFWHNMLLKKHIVYSLILTLIISEISWALTLWPTGFLPRSMVIFAVFYAFTTLSKHNFNKTLNKKTVISIIIISIIMLCLALLTTQWEF
ncbi:MAG: hypothetical protein WC663_02655 [Patescibacteria group bacterium]|jgi:hypothetical protein